MERDLITAMAGLALAAATGGAARADVDCYPRMASLVAPHAAPAMSRAAPPPLAQPIAAPPTAGGRASVAPPPHHGPPAAHVARVHRHPVGHVRRLAQAHPHRVHVAHAGPARTLGPPMLAVAPPAVNANAIEPPPAAVASAPFVRPRACDIRPIRALAVAPPINGVNAPYTLAELVSLPGLVTPGLPPESPPVGPPDVVPPTIPPEVVVVVPPNTPGQPPVVTPPIVTPPVVVPPVVTPPGPAGVPEPSSWALMVLGLTGLGLGLRVHRSPSRAAVPRAG